MNMALYYVILHWWTRVAGTSEIALRIPSVIFATATVPLVYAPQLGTLQSTSGFDGGASAVRQCVVH